MTQIKLPPINPGRFSSVLNCTFAQRRAADYIKSYCVPSFEVSPPYEEWEMELYGPPNLQGKI